MTKKLWQSRGEVRGGIYAGLQDRAFVTTMTHTQWTTPAWGGTRDLQIDLDGGLHSQIITLSPSTTYLLDDLIDTINTAFAGVGTVAFKFRAGRLQLRSTREGHESQVDISSSDADALALFDFDNTNVTGRTLEDAQENTGVEDNPAGTRMIATGEQHIKEVINRPAMYISDALNKIQGYANSYYAIPTVELVEGADLLTMDDVGGVRILTVTINTSPPEVGETITGAISAVDGVVANYIDNQIVVAPPPGGFTGSFSPGEALNGSVTGAGLADVITETQDGRIAACKLKGKAFVGGYNMFGFAAPSPDDFEPFAQLTIFKDAEGDGVPANTLGSAITSEATTDVQAGGIPYRLGERTRVKHFCVGVPDDPYSPSNVYDHQGIERQAAVNVTAWTKTRIYPASFAANVTVGDIAEITGSSDSGVALNNGRYTIIDVNASEGYYEIGPSKSAGTGGTLPEDTVDDPEIFENNGVSGVQVTVTSPSYLLEEGRTDSAAADTTGWVLFEYPVEPSNDLKLAYYVITNQADSAVGNPEFESPWSRYLRARMDTIESRLGRLHFGGLIRGTLLNNPLARQMGSFDDLVTIRSYGRENSVLDSATKYKFVGPIREHSVHLTTQPDEGVVDENAAFRSSTVITHPTVDGSHVGPVLNTTDRHISASVAVYQYTSRSTAPSHGDVMTGSTSSATMRFLADQPTLGNFFLAEVLSGLVQDGETFTWSGGAESATGVTFLSMIGFKLQLPWVTSGATATIAAGAQVVNFAAAPDDLDKVREGDMFECLDGPMATQLFKARIRNIDVPGNNLTLQVAQPYAGVAGQQWRVTPNLTSEVMLSGTTGGRAKAGSPYIIIDLAAGPDLLDAGVAPGDLVRVTTTPGGVTTDGTGQEYARIKSVVLSPAAQTEYILEVEESFIESIEDTTPGGAGVAWEIITTQQRVQTQRNGFALLESHTGDLYDGSIGSEEWLIKGPAYFFVPGNNYGTPNRGGAVGVPVSGVSLSGLSGKVLTVKLYRHGDLIESVQLALSSNPATLEAVAVEIQTQISAIPAADWLQAYSSTGQPGLVICTTALDSYTSANLGAYEAVGPGISIEIEGDAWDAITMSNHLLEYGNLSREFVAAGYDAANSHVVDNPPVSTSFQWSGVAALAYPRAELGTGSSSGINKLYGFHNNPSLTDGNAQDGTFVGDSRPSLALMADSLEFLGRQQQAITIGFGQKIAAYMSHGGTVGSYINTPVLLDEEGPDRGTDVSGNVGKRPALLHSGPINIFSDYNTDVGGDLEGYSITFLVGGGDTIQRVRVDLTSAMTDLDAIVAAIQSAFTTAGLTYLQCEVDESGLGFVIFYSETALLAATDLPQYHQDTFVAIDPRGTTFTDLYALDKDTIDKLYQSFGYYENPPTGPKSYARWLEGKTSIGETRGATEGLVTDHAAGRRLVSAPHGDLPSSPGTLPQHEAVVFEEVVGSLKHYMDPPGNYDLDAVSGEGQPQPENLITYGGSARGSGRVLLYQFAGDVGTDFDEGEEISLEDSDVSTGDQITAYAKDTKPVIGKRKFRTEGGHLTMSLVGQSLRVIRREDALPLHAGGSRVVGTTSGAVGYYNPVLVRMENIQNEPAWSAGDPINCVVGEGYAKGLYGTKFTLSGVTSGGLVVSENWYVIYASVDRWSSTSFTRELHRESWYGAVESSSYGTFSAQAVEVIHLDSNVYDGGNLRPIMALSNQSFNTNDRVMRKPAIHSFGDMTVPDDGDYLFRDQLPWGDTWPDRKRRYWTIIGTESAAPTIDEEIETSNHVLTEHKKTGVVIGNPGAGTWWVVQTSGPPPTVEDEWVGLTSGSTLTALTSVLHKDSALDAAKGARHGRGFTTECLAEDGKVTTVYSGGDITYPYQTEGMNERTISSAILTGTPQFEELSGSSTGAANHSLVWSPRSDDLGTESQEVITVNFHPKIPDGFTWIEGFGAYIRRDLNQPGDIYSRDDAIVALYAVGGQAKDGVFPYWGGAGMRSSGALMNNGFIHRLDVTDTQETIIRVDSAGGGMPGYDDPGISTKPLWAGESWAPFRPFPIFPHNERTLELYVEGLFGTEEPAVGMEVRVSDSTGSPTTYPGGMVKSGYIAYVEKYGAGVITAGPTTTPTVTAYRIILYMGPSSKDALGYPYEAGWASGATGHTPSDAHLYPWEFFSSGEKIAWSDDSFASFGGGLVVHTVTYPHGMNLRIKVHLYAARGDLGGPGSYYEDQCAGVYVRYRCDRMTLSRL